MKIKKPSSRLNQTQCHTNLHILFNQIISSAILIMNHQYQDLTEINEVNNDNTKITISNFENSSSLDNATSAQSNMSNYSRVIRGRRNRRELRRKTNALYPFVRRLPVQVSNNPLVNDFFNGSSFH
ncbi:hypothetical protein RhiirB3_532732 [Rhizophagus irregularis]|nr:hypothetical protein RhiirB3_532732 [Rhizophagus irregularis]